MCHSRDFRMFEARKERKSEDSIAAHDRRAHTISGMLHDANKPVPDVGPARAPVKEAAPAK